ncbi:phosphoglycerate dehydrogenase [Clostridium transplantifaecale]|uniref:phosphoglycerate dehydrogenase n=1 Tax=Clostridium transplantifaecale TaxID=2479838 RepID=UPI000F631DE8|nr:phosphoglycerate dehydrogenase [Clostridium transplantifaecale]
MANYKVVITARSFGEADNLAYQCLREAGCEWIKLTGTDMGQQIEAMKEADALIAGLEYIGEELMDAAPKLKVISRYGVGYENVDKQAALTRGIQITITPGANGNSVADLAVALMLDVARNVTVMDEEMKKQNQIRPQGLELYGKTLGVIGAGRIGRGVAERCRGFNMKILACDVCRNEEFIKKTGAEYVSMETLLREADFITIHSPLNEETRNMISKEQFGIMKRDAVLVNTARGGIVDEEALYEALSSGRIRGAALDATVNEPPYNSPLMQCNNCILTPHAGAATREASSKMSIMAAENAVTILQGKLCPFRVI